MKMKMMMRRMKDDPLWDELSYPNIHEGRRYGGAVNI